MRYGRSQKRKCSIVQFIVIRLCSFVVRYVLVRLQFIVVCIVILRTMHCSFMQYALQFYVVRIVAQFIYIVHCIVFFLVCITEKLSAVCVVVLCVYLHSFCRLQGNRSCMQLLLPSVANKQLANICDRAYEYRPCEHKLHQVTYIFANIFHSKCIIPFP